MGGSRGPDQSCCQAHASALHARLEQLERENEQLRRELHESKQQAQALESKLAGQQQELKKLKTRIKHLKNHGDRRDRRIAALKRDLKALQAVRLLETEATAPFETLHQALLDREKKIAELEERIAQLEQQGKRQANPFRRRKRKPKSKHKKSGRRKGRGQFKRRPTPSEDEVDQHLHSVLTECPHCGCDDLPEEKGERKNYQIDVPPVQLHVTCFHSQWCWCPSCGVEIQSRHGRQLSIAKGAANITFGPRTLALAADMHEHHGISYEKIAELFSSFFPDLTVERSTLCKALSRLTNSAETVYKELVQLLRNCAVVCADETGWRVGGANAWLWVFCNEHITVYDIRSGEGARGRQVVIDALGKHFEGVLSSDGFAAYDAKEFDAWVKQKCLGHLLRAFAELREQSHGAVLAFTVEVVACLKSAIALAKRRGDVDEQTYATECDQVETRMDDLLDSYARIESKDAARLRRRLLSQRPHLFTFLRQLDVDPTNNRAERDLRPGVITRKTQGCNKTDAGARKHVVLASISSTLHKQDRDVVDFLVKLQCPGEATPSVDMAGMQEDAAASSCELSGQLGGSDRDRDLAGQRHSDAPAFELSASGIAWSAGCGSVLSAPAQGGSVNQPVAATSPADSSTGPFFPFDTVLGARSHADGSEPSTTAISGDAPLSPAPCSEPLPPAASRSPPARP